MQRRRGFPLSHLWRSEACSGMKLIQSRDNPFFKELVKLAGSARQRSKENLTLLDGAHLLAAYLDAGMMPQRILLNESASRDDEIASLLERAGDVQVTQLDDKLFAELSELKTPTGILALIEIAQPAVPVAAARFALLLEDIQDPGNLGSMLRSAAATFNQTLGEIPDIQGKSPDSWNEYYVALALEKLELPYIYQFEIFGGHLRGGVILDFLVLTHPLSTPIFVNGLYWHKGKRAAVDLLPLRYRYLQNNIRHAQRVENYERVGNHRIVHQGTDNFVRIAIDD